MSKPSSLPAADGRSQPPDTHRGGLLSALVLKTPTPLMFLRRGEEPLQPLIT